LIYSIALSFADIMTCMVQKCRQSVKYADDFVPK
jgi:hypothetical protein